MHCKITIYYPLIKNDFTCDKSHKQVAIFSEIYWKWLYQIKFSSICAPGIFSLLDSFKSTPPEFSNKFNSSFSKLYRFCLLVMNITFVYQFITIPFSLHHLFSKTSEF